MFRKGGEKMEPVFVLRCFLRLNWKQIQGARDLHPVLVSLKTIPPVSRGSYRV